MAGALKNLRLNVFTFIEILLAFLVDTIVISLDVGNRQLQKAWRGADFPSLVIFNTFTLLAMLVTASGIMGIQLINVYRRKNEIGLRKAVGANDSDIFIMILRDTFLMILLPALIGAIIGTIISDAQPFHYFGYQSSTNPRVFFFCFLSLLVFTVASGILPAMKAMRLSPIDILRNRVNIRREKKRKAYNIVFYVIATITIISCIIINNKIQAAYRLDTVNTGGTPPSVSQEAPAFSFMNEQGDVISSDTLHGRKYCLLIWETGYPPSSDILNELNRFVTCGVVSQNDIYAVSIDKSIEKVKDYLQTLKVSITPLLDYKHATKWAFHAELVPAVYLIDENGIITHRILGWSVAVLEYLDYSIDQSYKKE